MGEIKLLNVDILQRTTFPSYVYSGAEISLIVGIDFTNSNQNLSDNNSLHYQNEEN